MKWRWCKEKLEGIMDESKEHQKEEKVEGGR